MKIERRQADDQGLTKDSKLGIRTEKTKRSLQPMRRQGHEQHQPRARLSVKSMDVDKEKLTDDKLAAGSTMTPRLGKDVRGLEVEGHQEQRRYRPISERSVPLPTRHWRFSGSDGKAAVQLGGGNAAFVGGLSKTLVCGETTINGKTEVKDELRAPIGESR